jgi:hypothetical protein
MAGGPWSDRRTVSSPPSWQDLMYCQEQVLLFIPTLKYHVPRQLLKLGQQNQYKRQVHGGAQGLGRGCVAKDFNLLLPEKLVFVLLHF